MKPIRFPGVTDSDSSKRAVTLWETLLVLAILALLAFFIVRSCSKGASSSAGSLLGSTTLSAAQETVKVVAKNFTIHMSPVPDCSQATANKLKSDVDAAQKKIDQAARDYPNDYAANKATLQRDIDILNQSIQAYNHDCGTNIPQITLPP